MNLYAYCLSEAADAADGVASLSGLQSAPVQTLRCAELVALVSEFEGETVRVTRENVLAHEAVVRRVLAQTTPLPFRFGTIITEARLKNYLDSQRNFLQAQLARVRGCVEMSVKVIWNPEGGTEDSAPVTKDEAATQSSSALSGGLGTAFLKAKQREISGAELLRKRAAEVAEWLEARLHETVREAQVSVQPGDSLVLAATHLVERARLNEYRAAIKDARAERPELHFLTSGAWPPYSFTKIGS